MPKKISSSYNLIVPLISTILSIIFLFSRATGLITDNYYNVFFPIIVAITLFLWGISYLETKPVVNKPFFFNEKMPYSPLSRMPLVAKLGLIGGLLALVFSLGAVGLGSPVIDLPQPFVQTAYSQVTQYDKLFYQSFIPGFFEEAAIFILASAFKFILFLTLFKRNPKAFLMIVLISSALGALILTQAHRIAYGSDQGAYIGIFIFEFVVQFANLFFGIFVSWIPHIIHNAVVTLNFLVAFSIGGVALSIIPIRRKKNG